MELLRIFDIKYTSMTLTAANRKKRARSFSFESDSTSTSSNSKRSCNLERVNYLQSFSNRQFVSSRISGRNQSHNSYRHNPSCNFRRNRQEQNDSSCSTSPIYYSLSSCDRSRFRKNECLVKSIFNRPNSPSSSHYEFNQSDKVIQTNLVVDKNYDPIYANNKDDYDDANAIFSTTLHQSTAQSPSSITQTFAIEDNKNNPSPRNKHPNGTSSYNFEELPMEWWERSPACKVCREGWVRLA